MQIPIFFLLGIWSLKSIGIGRTTTKESKTMFMIAVESSNPIKFPQWPFGIVLSKLYSSGLHMRSVPKMTDAAPAILSALTIQQIDLNQGIGSSITCGDPLYVTRGKIGLPSLKNPKDPTALLLYYPLVHANIRMKSGIP